MKSTEQAYTASGESFRGRLAVVTGGGTGMGRELVIQLAREGCSVAACDINPGNVAQTSALAAAAAQHGARITVHTCDVSDESQVVRFRDEVIQQHDTSFVNLVFNNAGIHSTGSFVGGDRSEWDRVFGVCWNGVYYCSRAFVPLLVAADSGCLVNTSSVNGFWAKHSAYSAAKFAVKGFTEALIDDFRTNAPHVKVALVMPGYVGTDIVSNSRSILEGAEARLSAAEQSAFRDAAPMSSSEAASVILDAVRAGHWRILVGQDAHKLDELVRSSDPVSVYGADGIKPEDLLDGDALLVMQTLASSGGEL